MPEDIIQYSLKVFTGFFAVMNPIAGIPVFLGLMGDRDNASKKKIARTACITAFLIVASFTILGKYIFDLFGITIPAFKVAGGILLFYIGFDMLQSKPRSMHNQNVELDDGIAISPLAIPLLAGPGTIVTAMNSVTDGESIHIAIVVGLFAFLCYLTYLSYSLSDLILKGIGKNLITVVGKIMGLILAIMGAGMVIAGIQLAFGL